MPGESQQNQDQGTILEQLRSSEEQLKRSNNHFEFAQRIAKLGSWTWDPIADISYWSKEVFRIFQLPEAEHGADFPTVLSMVHPDDRELLQKSIQQAIEDNKNYDIEFRLLRSDNSICHIHSIGKLERDSDGKPKLFIGVLQDITERKKLEQQYLRAQRLESIGTLAGGIAHDLNNVLAPIMMSIDLLKMKLSKKEPDLIPILESIGNSSKRGAELINQVLSFARGMEGHRVEVQLRHLIAEMEKIARETFPKNIQLHSSLQKDLWILIADPTQIHQIILNLCVNARDAMPNGGSIIIRAQNVILDESFTRLHLKANTGPYVKIEVEDTGEGIKPDYIEQIFDPFFTTKDVGKGTGLGLSTTLTITESHGGFIEVYSDLGQGSRFNVYLPAQQNSADSPSQEEIRQLPVGNGETVLLIDDEASVRLIASQTLENFGYKVITASNGAEAISIYATRHSEIDVVITDMMMPTMDGPATVKALRHFNPDVKIIGASGLTANSKIANTIEGLDHFILKPYSAEIVLTTLKKVLSK